MASPSQGPWYENPLAVGLLLALLLLVVLAVWLVGVGAAFVESAGGL